MKAILTILMMCVVIMAPAKGAVYLPTEKAGEFLRQFEKAYNTGDREWIESAIDKEGVIEEAKAVFLGFLGPKDGGETITGLSAIAAPEVYQVSNTLLDVEIEPTIPVDFILTFKRTVGGLETTIKVPVGYRDGKIWISGVKKKPAP